MAKSGAEKSAAWRTKMEEVGLCRICGKQPASEGSNSCPPCLVKINEYKSKRLRDYISKGICPLCRTRPIEGLKRCQVCADKYNASKREKNRQLRREVLDAYGGPVCRCCGETTEVFLVIDHVNDDGNEHRKITGSGSSFYQWLKKHNFPNDPPLCVLCQSCNWAKRMGGCPHQKQGKDYLYNSAGISEGLLY